VLDSLDKTHICIGVIKSAHGVKGEVKLKSFTDNPIDIFALSFLCDEKGKQYTIVRKGTQKELFIATIDGVSDRNQAEELKHTQLYTLREDLPELETDEFYTDDLIGLPVVLENGEKFGKVISVDNFGASDLLKIEDLEGNTEYHTFTEDIFPEFDEEKIVFCPPEML